MITITDEEYRLFKNYLLSSCGIEINEDKKYLFNTRFDKFFQAGHFKNFNELYLTLINNQNPNLHKAVIEVMTTNETAFFRDSHPFDALLDFILPEIIKIKEEEAKYFPPRIKIWSSACSTGQEPYSIAILLKEWVLTQNLVKKENVFIIASDISNTALEKAKMALYDNDEIKKGMREQYLGQYILKNKNHWKISDEIRNMVDFQEINLAKDFNRYIVNSDVIFCRNVIIYFSSEIKLQIINKFYEILNPKGFLIIGSAESLYGISDKFEVIHMGPTIIYRVKK